MMPGAFQSRGDFAHVSRLDALDPRCRAICAFICAIAIASLSDAAALLAASALPLLLLCVDGKRGLPFLAPRLREINKISVPVALFLALTYPGERFFYLFSAKGLVMALFVIWKLNLISVVLLRMAASMGITRINGAMEGLGFPLKLRALLLLTTRYIFLLADRVAAMSRAVSLRTGKDGGNRGVSGCRAYAYMIGTTLIHSSDRAERAALAIGCRGGMSGFSSAAPASRWTWKESYACLLFFLYSALLIAISLSQSGTVMPV
jgi:energy-coupling factor transporter transmembrane protein EcfT